MVEKKAYPGTISSIILSIVVLGILLIPFAMANHIQKVRDGEGKYDFKESICWDIDGEEDFNNEPEDVGQECGDGALGYWYDSDISLSDMVLTHTPVEGTVNGYGRGITVTCDGSVTYAELLIFLAITKEDIVENDITRIDIFLSISGIEECIYEGWLGYMFEEPSFELGEITIGELLEIEISVEDMLEINSFPDEEYLFLYFYLSEEDGCVIQPESIVIFDMQMYCMKELIITSLDWLGIAMMGGGIFMAFCSVLMLPHLAFGGIIGRIFGKEE